jgi:hypothetical protein
MGVILTILVETSAGQVLSNGQGKSLKLGLQPYKNSMVDGAERAVATFGSHL